MFLKLMSGEDLPDQDNSKPYRLIECRDVQFERGSQDGFGWATADGVPYALQGNAYILNANGKTVDSYWAKQAAG